MLKYYDTSITCLEVPDEISLAFSISGCQIRCKDCHSKHLWDDVGIELSFENVLEEFNKHKHLSCILLMGGEHDKSYIFKLATKLRTTLNIKTAWYTGENLYFNQELLNAFDYVKFGPYVEEFGGLSLPTTNQIYLQRTWEENPFYIDIAHKFRMPNESTNI